MPCYHCQKGIIFGRSHTHHRGVAGGRWKKRAQKTPRIFQPNLQHIQIMEEGREKRVKLCTKCIKRIRKDVRDGVRPFIQLKSTASVSRNDNLPKTEAVNKIKTKKPSEKKSAAKKTPKKSTESFN